MRTEDFNYNFVSGSYGVMDIDDLNVDGDVYSIGVSFEVADNFHVFGDYLGSNLDCGRGVRSSRRTFLSYRQC